MGPGHPTITEFSGLVQSCKAEGREYGLFHEKHGRAFEKWTVRARPLGPGDAPADSWGLPIWVGPTKRDALAAFGARDALLPGLAR